ncbi:hypothetical protein GGF32_005761 [Allomyces javanicus]|nr:hypothetical protein GGF32_005761 [Allomyces javanicus]
MAMRPDRAGDIRMTFPFWTRNTPVSLHYMWMRDTPATIIAVLRAYATRHQLTSTLLFDLDLLAALQVGDAAAIAAMMKTRRLPSPTEEGFALTIERGHHWVPAMLATHGHLDAAISLVNQNTWNTLRPSTWTQLTGFAVREGHMKLANRLLARRPEGVDEDIEPVTATSPAMVGWLAQSETIKSAPYFLIHYTMKWMHEYSRHEGIAVMRAFLASPRWTWTLQNVIGLLQH